MGKKTKEHRAKVEKRNRKIAQGKYAVQNALNKMMKQMAEQEEAEKLKIEIGEKEVPFEVVSQPVGNSLVDFKESNPDMFTFTDAETTSENE